MDIELMLKQAENRYIKRMSKYDWFNKNERPFNPALKYFKKLGVFKASNVLFNPNTMTATSYNWWEFVKKINGKVVFNIYRYSNTTSKHQSKVKSLLKQLNIKIDIEAACPDGLQNLDSGVRYYERIINDLKNDMNNPRSYKEKNRERKKQIKFFQNQIEVLKELQISENERIAA